MNENEFFQEILENGNVWVAIKNKEVLTLANSEGIADLPVWSNIENAEDFLSKKTMNSLGAVSVPLITFKIAWLTEGKMDFDELIINPKAKESKYLVLTKKEFLNHIQH